MLHVLKESELSHAGIIWMTLKEKLTANSTLYVDDLIAQLLTNLL
jgi:hypothetical protein